MKVDQIRRLVAVIESAKGERSYMSPMVNLDGNGDIDLEWVNQDKRLLISIGDGDEPDSYAASTNSEQKSGLLRNGNCQGLIRWVCK